MNHNLCATCMNRHMVAKATYGQETWRTMACAFGKKMSEGVSKCDQYDKRPDLGASK